jgi:hypothetical protein
MDQILREVQAKRQRAEAAEQLYQEQLARWTRLRDAFQAAAGLAALAAEHQREQHLTTVDSEHVRRAWQKAIDRRKYDPDGAITIARTLVEAVCKRILGSGAYEHDWDLPRLYREAARLLRLDPDRHADESLKTTGNCSPPRPHRRSTSR